MVRRISPSQYRSMVRQAQSKQRQAINQFNQRVRSHNAKIRQAQNRQRQAINKFNQEVRTHNARVRANRDRLRRELQKLTRASSRPQYATFRTSVEAVQRSYLKVERRADSNQYDERYNFFLDLAEQEAANSVSVINALQGEEPEPQREDQFTPSRIDPVLSEFSSDVRDRWHGALFALDPKNPDAARHFCTSARELLTAILERFASDGEVHAEMPYCDLTPQGKPTRRSKIRFLLQKSGISDDAITEFVENNMENVVQLFNVCNSATHGSSGKFNQLQLHVIRARVENAICFLGEIILGRGLNPV
ncbi:MAG: hypothetical protein F4133_08395 [Gammaproteobacteria bacterium]|nr:hypothetical protein [Gammaproteobacteria bacterium]